MTDAVQAAGWAWRGIVAWDKQNARPQIGKFRQQCEYVVFVTKGRFVPYTRTCLPGVYSYPVISAQKVHLTSKPVALIENLLDVTSPQDGRRQRGRGMYQDGPQLCGNGTVAGVLRHQP